ncbi:sn-glycerol-3-phosphate ABC transporter ATP-binding protein UgpC [Mesorhizobium sp. AD1-1]|uniref:ABC transporter ATP-binding protein n=1 Tax=Mesorhizobium sp. AD1-1 TaxID=2876621 RepID=UPI001CCA7622|nr:sn-glycerol-3-phosphate ABC transporter ATP-binding protein UgpC [Mesorhizobium sp. AD1-1]MBZ9719232.1 sn-glycerol-3-phosphate ABC transporter ATP-binding protein UgpC [Mesorhizobium sp. AD1-1]
MASVSIENIRKAYDAAQVIHGVSIEIEDGEFVVLVGPSGCGKSTLLRMIAGLENISGGEIRIGDRVVNDIAPKSRDVAMVFQNYALYPHMTVRANMEFSLTLRGESSEVLQERVHRAAEILGLTELLARYPRELSGGQRQRVAMGRAIVRDPKVFLFDEPLSNLDAKLRVKMRSEIKELHQRLGTTIIYVTHDQIEAMTMADKIVVMNDGRVEQAGAPLDVYDKPVNRFVAGFIGSPAMNFLEGRIDAGRDGAFVTNDGARLALPAAHQDIRGQPVIFGVRPEHFEAVPLGTPNALEAIVSVVEPTGSETLVLARIGKQEVTAAFRQRHNLKPGDRLMLKPDFAQSHLFEQSTSAEKRIEMICRDL